MKHLAIIHLDFLYTAVSWVLLRWHQLFSLFLSKDSGLNWSLSIVMLVVTARLLLFRLFIKQVHFQRRMQEMAPKLNELKAKYKDDKQLQQQEIMKLQREEGFNPVTGCLPLFLQIPVFLGLYHVLRHLADSNHAAYDVTQGKVLSAAQVHQLTLYSFSQSETVSAARAKLFGAPLAASFHDGAATLANLGGDVSSTRLVVLPLLVISALATFATQLLVRANQTTVPTGTNATIQRVFLWVFPLGVLASGLIFNFPLGVLLYWFTSNTWTLAQQAYIIRFHPPEAVQTSSAPSAAAKALAPRPGQKPNYDRSRPAKATASEPAADNDQPADRKPDVTANGAGAAKSVGKPAGGPAPEVAAPAAPAAPTAPRPQPSGQRGNRPGNRPAAKRPSQAKKRR